MAKSCVFLLLGSLLVLLVAAEATIDSVITLGEKKPVGGSDYKRIDVTEPRIHELVRLTVAIHNWQKGSELQLEGVSCGRSETVLNGIDYNFCLFAGNKAGTEGGMFTALVFVDAATNNIRVNSFFQDIDCCFGY